VSARSDSWAPRHVRWFPREDVSVSPEEADKRVFLFRVEARPDGGGIAAVACPKVNHLDLNLLSWLRLVVIVRLLWNVEFTWASFLDAA
jgi:hypothetical protein